MDHVRAVDDDHWLFPGEQIGVGPSFEDMLVVVIRGEVAAIIVPRQELYPVDGVEEGGTGEFALDVLLEEADLELLEDTVPKEAIISRGKAPAGNPRDHVDLVQERQGARLVAGGRHVDFLERL